MPPLSVYNCYGCAYLIPNLMTTESLPAICHWIQVINLLSVQLLKRKHQMGSCSTAFCHYSLFLKLAAEDSRIQVRLSAIKRNIWKQLPTCTEIKALLAETIQHLTCCVYMCWDGSTKMGNFLKQQICAICLCCLLQRKVYVLVKSVWVFEFGLQERYPSADSNAVMSHTHFSTVLYHIGCRGAKDSCDNYTAQRCSCTSSKTDVIPHFDPVIKWVKRKECLMME